MKKHHQREEVKNMKYEKPTVTAVATAMCSIQAGQHLKNGVSTDFASYGWINDFRPTAGAYEADE